MFNYDYVKCNTPWYFESKNIKCVAIEHGVTSIGDDAFYNCNNLSNIKISNTVTSIGERAFWECISLFNITIPDSVMNIGEGAFYYTAYYNNFANWENEALYIGDFLIKADYSLTGAYAIKSTTKAIADSAFAGCGITSIKIPDSVTNIGDNVFELCTHLKEINVDENNKYYSSSDIGILYNKKKTVLVCCPSGAKIASFKIPNTVTTIGDYAFQHCDLIDITIPESVTSIGDYAFENCYSLETLVISDSVTSIGCGAFFGAFRLVSINIGKDNKTFVVENGVLYNKNKTIIICCPPGAKITSFAIPDSVTSIGNYAFSDCSNLKSITIPDGVTSIGDYSFKDCSNIQKILIPNSVTSIGKGAFYGCGNISDITIPGNVNIVGDYICGNCSSLKHIYIEGSIEGWSKIWNNLCNAQIHYEN